MPWMPDGRAGCAGGNSGRVGWDGWQQGTSDDAF